MQVGSFAERGNAEGLSDWCREQGLGVKIVSTTEGSRTTYRVLVGPYESRESAREAVVELARQGSRETRGAWVTRWRGATP